MRLSLLFLLPLLGCPPNEGDKPPVVDTSVSVIDEDGDGWLSSDGDCDDNDATVHPDGVEVCDGADNDCDGDTDEDVATSAWPDVDGDGFGDAAAEPTVGCAPEGVDNAGDCNDADAAIHPDAVEVCDGVDQNCDTVIDDGVTPGTWYADTDLDGYGDPTVTTSACDAPDGYVADGTDCDDTNTAFHPGADEADCADPNDYNCDGSTGYADADGDGYAACQECDDSANTVNPAAPEACNDTDDDCDGTVDEDAVDPGTWYADADGDGYGDDTVTQTACDMPAGYVSTGGDCDDADAAYNPSATEVCTDARDLNCDGSVGYADADGDGYAACEDCDDTDAAVNDAAVEACDGIDNNCDGTVDEDSAVDAATWYADADADGYGDAEVTTSACDAPVGYSASAEDCDDGDARFHPGADESDCADPNDYNCDGSVAYTDADADGWAACQDCDDGTALASPGSAENCDGIDNDCDGTTDEDAVDGSTYYADADADGYGSATTLVSCDTPVGYATVSGDCDDASDTFHPGAAEDDCTDPNDYNCDGSVGYSDADGDGSPACEDCDDTASAIHPGATETCDAIDNDCDLAVDESGATGETTWYADVDGDGYGDPAATLSACDAPAGYVFRAGDCDDTRVSVNPAGTETCDGLDDDCDGDVDEPDATDASEWYADADGDGYGDPDVAQVACDQPSGYLADATDCDDGTSTTHPSAAESCNGADDDCDGTTDEDSAIDAPTWYQDGDSDGYGGTSTTRACSQPSGYVATSTDCDDAAATFHPGATETCDGYDDDCDGLTDEAGASGAPTWYADADSDGYGDEEVSADSCSQPSGYVADDTDCDDSAGSVNPAAIEYCDGVDNNCDGSTDGAEATGIGSWFDDADRDGYGDAAVGSSSCAAPAGYVASSTDCDDTRASDHPGASEYCDTRDNDCDGSTDESAVDRSTWYADVDSDGYGDPTASSLSCTMPSGSVADSSDCDDATAGTHPGATETCDGVDQDCDGTADDGATGSSTWYVDSDGDGYGTTSATSAACSMPSGYAAVSGDCDDASASVRPGGTESCNGTDDDCDGETDEGGIGTTWYADVDGDGYGDSTNSVSACDAPTGYLADGTDCDDMDSAVSPDATEVCENNRDDDCSGDSSDCDLNGVGAVSDADRTWSGVATNDYVGSALAGGGDLNCDGIDDMVIGANGIDNGGTANIGRSYVYFGNPSTSVLTSANAILSGTSAGDNTGDVLAMVGDTDADGCDDLLVGAHLVNGAATDSGAAYLVKGSATLSSRTLSTTANTVFSGSAATDYVGWGVAGAGDINDDGRADMLIGGYKADSGYTDNGLVGLYYGGGVSATETLTAADVTFSGGAASDYAGFALAGAGDVDGDGVDDFLVGAYQSDTAASNAGSVYLVLGPAPATVLTPSSADSVITGAASSDYLGYAVAGLGDTTGDGTDDFALGAYGSNSAATDAGAVYVFTSLPASSASATTASAILLGVASSDNAGKVLAGAQDVNNDGFADLLVSAPGYDPTGASGAGAFYLLYGPMASGSLSGADAAWYGAAASDGAEITSLSTAGDLDSDGYDDILYAATGADPASISKGGTAYLFYGTGD